MQVRVGPAAVNVDQGRVAVSGRMVGGHVQETLDVEAVVALERDLDGVDHDGPLRREMGQATEGTARRGDQVNIRAACGGGASEGEEFRAGRSRDRAERTAHVRDPGRHAARDWDGPEVEVAALVVGEMDTLAVAGPEDAHAVQPIGGVDLHLHRAFGVRRRVENEDVREVLVPVAVLVGAQQGDRRAVGGPGGLGRDHQAA